jgi:hypothetical protein
MRARLLSVGLAGLFLLVAARQTACAAQGLRFEITMKQGLPVAPKAGRLFVILSRNNQTEPRLELGNTGPDRPTALARDLARFGPGSNAVVDAGAFIFPLNGLSALPTGDYFVQALFDCDTDLRSPEAPGNLFSTPRKVHLDSAQTDVVRLELSDQVPPETLPPETEVVKFIRIQSQVLSKFHGRPIFLRAGIILPKDYEREQTRRYPLCIEIGGLNTRYTVVNRLMSERSSFRRMWLGTGTPRLILLQLDGAGPLGDPYQINSANSGPYGDALLQELIPAVEARFRTLGEPRGRFLTGTSTGGWVSLALQIFYPDFFNGAWSSCPDPVDFHALQLVNIYRDTNAYVNAHGNERLSTRDVHGDAEITMRHEVGVENLLGRGNSYTHSGEQWGEWCATFSPRGTDGSPVPIWDPRTGQIDPAVAEAWKKYDLKHILETDWPTLGPKLRGKIHIAAGESDQYFLNNAVHILDEFLKEANPRFEGKIVFGPGKRHGWMDLSDLEILKEMEKAAQKK